MMMARSCHPCALKEVEGRRGGCRSRPSSKAAWLSCTPQEKGAQMGLTIPRRHHTANRAEQAGLVFQWPRIGDFGNVGFVPTCIPPHAQPPECGGVNEKGVHRIWMAAWSRRQASHTGRPIFQRLVFGVGCPSASLGVVRSLRCRKLAKRARVLSLVAVVATKNHGANFSRFISNGLLRGEFIQVPARVLLELDPAGRQSCRDGQAAAFRVVKCKTPRMKQ